MSDSVHLDKVECGDRKMYCLRYRGTEPESVPVNEAKEYEWWKSRLILIPIPSSDVPPRIIDRNENAESGEADKKSSPHKDVLETAGDGEVNTKSGRHEDALSNNGKEDVDEKPDAHEKVLETVGNGEVEKTPKPYQNLLKKICNNLESRFESRFRSYREDSSACFLQFHTMQAPVLADLNVTLAMVDHIGVSNDSNGSSVDSIDRHEQIVAFINIQKKKVAAGQEPADKTDEMVDRTEDSIKEIFDGVIKYYIEEDREDAGVTPMLFIAAFLKWYGFEGRDAIAKGFRTLTNIDKTLYEQDKKVTYGNLGKQAKECHEVNRALTSLNQSLIGLRSRVNYVAESARSLQSHVSTMKEYIVLEIQRDQYNTTGQCSKGNIDCIVNKLENSVFVKRDGDKFDMIERAMQQYQTDIKSLKAHLAINIGLVSNLYAQLLTEKAARDSANMLLISTLGAILLPTTFSCILLTTPIFKSWSWRPTLGVFLGLSFVLAGVGVAIKFFYSWRKRTSNQKDETQDKKEQDKKGFVIERIGWWPKLHKSDTVSLESGTVSTAVESEKGTEHSAATVGKESTTKEPEPSSKKVKPDPPALKIVWW